MGVRDELAQRAVPLSPQTLSLLFNLLCGLGDRLYGCPVLSFRRLGRPGPARVRFGPLAGQISFWCRWQ